MTTGTDPIGQANRANKFTEPARAQAAVTPSDTNELTNYSRALLIGTGGNVCLVLVDDSPNSVGVTHKNIASGTLLPYRVRQVRSTLTTAADIVAVW